MLGLVRAGSLVEATAGIQRDLGALPATDDAPKSHDSSRPGPAEPEWQFFVPATKGPSRNAAAPSSRQPRPSGRGGLQPGARFIAASYSNEAGTRSYKLYIPSGYTGKAMPLIVMLHGCQQDPDDFAAGTRMNEVAEECGCLVAYPAQSATANASNCWSWFQKADQMRDRGEPSIIAGITREIIAAYCIETRAVFVAGLSAGGAGWPRSVGATYPDLYAAVGVHSGLPYAAAHDLTSAFGVMRRGADVSCRRRHADADGSPQYIPSGVPMIVFHGDHDRKVHPRNAEQLISQWAAADGQNTRSLRTTVDHGQVTGGHAYTREVYRDAAARRLVENWRVHGAGHAWSGGSTTGSYTDPRGPDATREMFRFFRQNLKPGSQEADMQQTRCRESAGNKTPRTL